MSSLEFFCWWITNFLWRITNYFARLWWNDIFIVWEGRDLLESRVDLCIFEELAVSVLLIQCPQHHYCPCPQPFSTKVAWVCYCGEALKFLGAKVSSKVRIHFMKRIPRPEPIDTNCRVRASFGGLGKKRVKMNIGESDDGLGKFLGDLDSSFSEIVLSSSPPAVQKDEGYTSCIRIRGRPILPPIMSQVITMTNWCHS